MCYSSCTKQKAGTTLHFGVTVACALTSSQDGKFQPEHTDTGYITLTFKGKKKALAQYFKRMTGRNDPFVQVSGLQA